MTSLDAGKALWCELIIQLGILEEILELRDLGLTEDVVIGALITMTDNVSYYNRILQERN